jgi:hypothetical protein
MRARDLLYMKWGKNVSAYFKPGVHKSRAADRRDIFILGLSVWNWLHVSLLAPRFLENLCTSVVGYFVLVVTPDKT